MKIANFKVEVKISICKVVKERQESGGWLSMRASPFLLCLSQFPEFSTAV